MILVDNLFKYSHLIPLKHPYSANTVTAEMRAKEVVRLHGVAKSTLSDRDPLFMSFLEGGV